MSIYDDVRKKGIYYNPANKHYDGKGSVSCDKCKKDDLTMCIGWKDNDLCLDCVNGIKKVIKKQSIKKHSIKKPKTSTKRPKARTRSLKKRMRQRQFR
jgi:hypothetical protein